MSTREHEPGKFEMFLILTLPFVGTAVVIALAYWLYQLDISSRT